MDGEVSNSNKQLGDVCIMFTDESTTYEFEGAIVGASEGNNVGLL